MASNLDIAALRKIAGDINAHEVVLPVGHLAALLDAAEERDRLHREVATNRDQIKTLQDLIRGDLTPAGIEVAQWRAERDDLLAALERGVNFGHNDDCMFCGFKDRNATVAIAAAKETNHG